MISNLSKAGIEGNSLNLIKTSTRKPIANNILNDEKLDAFTPKTGNKAKTSYLTAPVQHGTGSP